MIKIVKRERKAKVVAVKNGDIITDVFGELSKLILKITDSPVALIVILTATLLTFSNMAAYPNDILTEWMLQFVGNKHVKRLFDYLLKNQQVVYGALWFGASYILVPRGQKMMTFLVFVFVTFMIEERNCLEMAVLAAIYTAFTVVKDRNVKILLIVLAFVTYYYAYMADGEEPTSSNSTDWLDEFYRTSTSYRPVVQDDVTTTPTTSRVTQSDLKSDNIVTKKVTRHPNDIPRT